MSAIKKPADPKILKTLVPISSLVPANFQKLADKTFIEELPPGQTLFKQGDIDNWTFYVLSGEIVLTPRTGAARSVAGGTDMAKHPLAAPQPRAFTATAKTPVSFIRVEAQWLDVLLTMDQQVAGYEVTEFEGDGEWIMKLLQSKTFLKLPTTNIQNLLARLQEVQAKAGEVVIKQGDKGDYYYIIQQGRCQVTRRASDKAEGVPLAELKEGDSFGEEALLSDAPRNATITMLSDGVLMRLSKTDFAQLMQEPLVNWLAQADGVAMVRAGAGLIDVRLENEYKNGNIKGSINMPLYMVRLKAETLDMKRKYVLYCDTGRRSAAAAFLLGERGFDVYVLKGGMGALQKPPGG